MYGFLKEPPGAVFGKQYTGDYEGLYEKSRYKEESKCAYFASQFCHTSARKRNRSSVHSEFTWAFEHQND